MFMVTLRERGWRWLSLGLVAVIVAAGNAGAAPPVIIANRTNSKVVFDVIDMHNKVQPQALAPGDLLSTDTVTVATVRYTVKGTNRDVQLADNTINYFVVDKAGALELARVTLVQTSTPPPDANKPRAALTPAAGTAVPAIKPLVIPVKVLVDDDERSARNVWRGRLTRRIQAASDLLEKYCHARLEIVSFGEWVSDNRITDFNASLAEFEHKVALDKARIAIGFTSQYELGREIHLGGTRGALHSHILIREHSNQIGEPERLEVLLHEVGHFFGAVHIRDTDSVMRSILGDRQARAKDFRIGLDPLNTLATALVVEEYRQKPVSRLGELPVATRQELLNLYVTLGRANPRDPTPEQYIELLQLPRK